MSSNGNAYVPFRREQHLLQDIIENGDAIIAYLDGLGPEEFEVDRKTIDAVERCFQRLTEAAIKIGKDRMAEIVPELPLEAVRGLGNRLRHAYHAINLRMLFDTAYNHLPGLLEACRAALDDGDLSTPAPWA